jgi:F-type H+-transporting ATPase subunit b
MEILSQLGIDGKLLLAQGVNFLVLLFILHRFVYKPMLAFLEKRTERIEEGLKNAEEARKRLDEASKSEERILAEAREEAKKIVIATSEASEKRGQEMVAEFEKKAEKIVEEAKERAKEEREKLFREAKGEIADLVIATTEKVLREKLSSTDQRNVTKYLEKE